MFCPFYRSYVAGKAIQTYSRMGTRRCLVFTGGHYVVILPVFRSGRGSLYASISKWRTRYECRRKLKAPFRSGLAYLSIISSPRQTFGKQFGRSVLKRLAFSFSLLFWPRHVMVLSLLGRGMRGFVVKGVASCPFRCLVQVAYYVLLTTKIF